MIKVINYIDTCFDFYIERTNNIVRSFEAEEFIAKLAKPHSFTYEIREIWEGNIENWEDFSGLEYLARGDYKSCDEDALHTFDRLWETYCERR